jgi:hypothetical protein
MANRDPWIKFYPKDYLADLELATCSAAAQGVYMRLICLMHVSNEYGYVLISGAKPTPHSLSKAMQMRSDTVAHSCAELVRKRVLKVDERGILYSQRMLSDRAAREQAREAGAKGGNPLLVNPTVKATVKRDTEQKENKNKKNIYSALFEEFWQEYPRKIGKQAAYECWNKRLGEGVSEDSLIASAKNYADECFKEEREEQYIKHPSTFLGSKRFYDDYIDNGKGGMSDEEYRKRVQRILEQPPRGT